MTAPVNIPDEAVNALAEHLWGFAPGPREAKRNMARKMLADVYPLIRADIATRIADELERYSHSYEGDAWFAVRAAADVARGFVRSDHG